jgi:hypothetical protein
MKKQLSKPTKATPETVMEARRLKAIWDRRERPSQADFGEQFGIGNQSAVGQFLRGVTPLSLKAARGFAAGLGCNIEDFSPRLAEAAAVIANMVPGDRLTPESARLASEIDGLSPGVRKRVLLTCHEIIALAKADPDEQAASAHGTR